MAENNTLTIEDAQILGGAFRNFAGKEGKYNREGDRSFHIALDRGLAEQLAKDGWNIKWLEAREDGDEDQAILEVAVNYRSGRPPRIVLVTSRGKNALTEDTVETVDYAVIEKADVIINPYHWNVNGKTGIKAYAQTLFILIREDELERKYADMDQV